MRGPVVHRATSRDTDSHLPLSFHLVYRVKSRALVVNTRSNLEDFDAPRELSLLLRIERRATILMG